MPFQPKDEGEFWLETLANGGRAAHKLPSDVQTAVVRYALHFDTCPADRLAAGFG